MKTPRPTFVAALALIVVGSLSGPSSASAAWQVRVSASSITASIGTLAAPSLRCETLASNPPAARITWDPVPGATSYRVELSNTVNGPRRELATQTTTGIDVGGALLTTLVSFLLNSLLAGGTVFVTVTATSESWTATSTPQRIGLAGTLLDGLSGGIRCR